MGGHGFSSAAVVFVAGVGLGGGEAEVALDPGQGRIQCVLMPWVATQGR